MQLGGTQPSPFAATAPRPLTSPTPGGIQLSPFAETAPRPTTSPPGPDPVSGVTQPENAVQPLTQGAVDGAPETNASRLRDAATAATSAARKIGDSLTAISGLADTIGLLLETGNAPLAGPQITELRAEAERVYVALHGVLTDVEHAKDHIDGLVADDAPAPCPNCGQPASSGLHASENLRDCPTWVPGEGWIPAKP